MATDQIVLRAAADFQRTNGFFKRDIVDLLEEFGALVVQLERKRERGAGGLSYRLPYADEMKLLSGVDPLKSNCEAHKLSATAPLFDPKSISDSDRVIASYLAPEWDEMSSECKEWVEAIISETLSRVQGVLPVRERANGETVSPPRAS